MVETLVGLKRALIPINARGVHGLAPKGGSDGVGTAGGLTGVRHGHVEALAQLLACSEKRTSVGA